MIDYAPNLTFAGRQDLISKDTRHHFTVLHTDSRCQRPVTANSAFVSMLPFTGRGNYLRLSIPFWPEDRGISEQFALLDIPSANYVNTLDKVLGEVRMWRHVRTGSCRNPAFTALF